ncbi:pyocin activator PrtN family protein [Acinetobacter kyonggiensis]|nr:pyocin activator PrtN family protein [Acinetobacter kyonggiensis]
MNIAFKISTSEYLFMKYRSMTVELMTIVSDYYPHLSKAEALRKANNQEFPFSIFKIDKSKRAPFLVHVQDLADVLDTEYSKASKDFATFHR